MQVLITSPKGKEKLVKAFESLGMEIVKNITNNTKLIIPTVDEELPFFASSRNWFFDQGIRVMVGSDYTINICRDKAEFYLFCRRYNFYTTSTMQESLIAKPRFGKGSKGIIKLDRSYIVQPFVDLPEISIDYFADWEGNPLSIIPRFRMGIVNGESTAVSFVEGIDLTEVIRLGKELGLIGHNVIQGFLTKDNQIIFSEVNPRFGGGSWMTFKFFHSPQWLTRNCRVPMQEMRSPPREDTNRKERQEW